MLASRAVAVFWDTEVLLDLPEAPLIGRKPSPAPSPAKVSDLFAGDDIDDDEYLFDLGVDPSSSKNVGISPFDTDGGDRAALFRKVYEEFLESMGEPVLIDKAGVPGLLDPTESASSMLMIAAGASSFLTPVSTSQIEPS